MVMCTSHPFFTNFEGRKHFCNGCLMSINFPWLAQRKINLTWASNWQARKEARGKICEDLVMLLFLFPWFHKATPEQFKTNWKNRPVYLVSFWKRKVVKNKLLFCWKNYKNKIWSRQRNKRKKVDLLSRKKNMHNY